MAEDKRGNGTAAEPQSGDGPKNLRQRRSDRDPQRARSIPAGGFGSHRQIARSGAAMTDFVPASEISRRLADRILQLVKELLPNGRLEKGGSEWRVGSVYGEPGSSLAVQLVGPKAGLWFDHATGQGGDSLDLVRAVRDVDMSEAWAWSCRWLGIEPGSAEIPPHRHPPPVSEPKQDPDRWRYPWQPALPIAGTLAETYLAGRDLRFDDPAGRVLRFASQRARKGPEDELEYHPALLCAQSDARSGEQCGIINIYLKADGTDRLRDKKGKTVTGRAAGAVVMLSAFDEVTAGLIVCEGVETGIALFQAEMRPVWACGGTSTLAKFPLLGGIESLTIAADADAPGLIAAAELADHWRVDGREVLVINPPLGDWAESPK
jgi:hypothetical protein